MEAKGARLNINRCLALAVKGFVRCLLKQSRPEPEHLTATLTNTHAR